MSRDTSDPEFPPDDTPKGYITKTVDTVDDAIEEAYSKGYERLKFDISDLCQRLQIHERTLRQYYPLRFLDRNFEAVEYEKWNGATVLTEKYLLERGIISEDDIEKEDDN